MATLIADDQVCALLKQATELTEILDRGGKTLGYFSPVRTEELASSQSGGWPTPTVLAEIEESRTDPKSSTLRGIFEQLMTLAQNPADHEDLQKRIEVQKERDACDSQ